MFSESTYKSRSVQNEEWLRSSIDLTRNYPHCKDIIEYHGKRWMIDRWHHCELTMVYLISWEGLSLRDAYLMTVPDEKTGIMPIGYLFREKYSGHLVNERSRVIARYEDNYVPIDLTGGAV